MRCFLIGKPMNPVDNIDDVLTDAPLARRVFNVDALIGKPNQQVQLYKNFYDAEDVLFEMQGKSRPFFMVEYTPEEGVDPAALPKRFKTNMRNVKLICASFIDPRDSFESAYFEEDGEFANPIINEIAKVFREEMKHDAQKEISKERFNEAFRIGVSLLIGAGLWTISESVPLSILAVAGSYAGQGLNVIKRLKNHLITTPLCHFMSGYMPGDSAPAMEKKTNENKMAQFWAQENDSNPLLFSATPMTPVQEVEQPRYNLRARKR